MPEETTEVKSIEEEVKTETEEEKPTEEVKAE
jgi:hypothetical protein